MYFCFPNTKICFCVFMMIILFLFILNKYDNVIESKSDNIKTMNF